MAFHRCVGLMVHDDDRYRRYREAMVPLLHQAGGRFRYDFRVADTLISETPAPINRVFMIVFDTRDAHDAFFADPAYLAVRETHFAPSVSHATILAAWEA